MTLAEVELQVERFKAALRKAGARLTHQRIEIFREVLSSESHPDVEEVFRGVKQRLHEVSLDTVYRTLWSATELGLLTTFGHRDQKLRFDANLRPHHHYVCVRCGAILDIEANGFGELPVPEGASALGSVESTHVELRGVCNACAGKPNHPGTMERSDD